MKTAVYWTELCLFLAVLACYAAFAYPTIAPRDSADMAAAAVTLGVAHPPGYPLYFILGKAWCLSLPLGNPAYRLNLLSAVCGALAVVAVYALIKRKTGNFWAGLAGGLAFAFSASPWKFSGLEEMYSLHALLAAVLLLLAAGDGRFSARRFYLSALLFGLGLVNHQTLILLAPCLAYLWRGEFKRHQIQFSRAAKPALFFFSSGLALYAAVWIRLGNAPLAWAVLTRAEYGSLTLAGQFSSALSWSLAGSLLSFLITELGGQISWLAAIFSLWGAWKLWNNQREFFWGIFLAFMAFGPAYFLMTKFDVSDWIARSVLETAFIIPSLLAAVAAGFGIAGFRRGLAPALAAALAGAAFFSHQAGSDHRDDFSAYDYAKDIRRSLPPGCAVLVAGDTAQFALKYLDALEKESPSRALRSSLEENNGRWIAEQLAARPVYTVGLSHNDLLAAGLWGNPYYLSPGGVSQKVGSSTKGEAGPEWKLSVRRPSRAAARGESYARDILFSYAYAHYVSGQLYERMRYPDEFLTEHYQQAALLDPENYKVERISL